MSHASAAAPARQDVEAPLLNGNDEADEHMHYSHRAPWLRAFVLGANDGLVSVASLMLGVGAASSDLRTMQLSGVAGLVAGWPAVACWRLHSGRHAARVHRDSCIHCGPAAVWGPGRVAGRCSHVEGSHACAGWWLDRHGHDVRHRVDLQCADSVNSLDPV